MKENLIKAITFVFDKIKPKNRSGKKIRMDIIKFIVGYIIFVFTMFLIGWGFLWYNRGVPDLLLLLKGIEALAVVKFVCDTTSNVAGKFIDKNHNGIDDREE